MKRVKKLLATDYRKINLYGDAMAISETVTQYNFSIEV